jgi:hypothetical protein
LSDRGQQSASAPLDEGLEIRGPQLDIPSEGVIGFSIRAVDALSVEDDPASEERWSVVQNDDIDFIEMGRRDELRGQAQPHFEALFAAQVRTQEDRQIDIALPMRTSLDPAAEEIGGYDIGTGRGCEQSSDHCSE